MFCWPRSQEESWVGRALCEQTDRFPHLAAAADSRESSSKVLGAAAVSQSEITALLQQRAGTASLFTPQLRAVRLDDTGEKAIHACEGHKCAKAAAPASSEQQSRALRSVRAWLLKGTLQCALNATRATLPRKKGISFHRGNYCSSTSKQIMLL